jgi:hypothetical protein
VPVSRHPVIVEERRPAKALRPGRVVLVGLFLAVLATAGALTWEATWIRSVPPPSDRVALTSGGFPACSCSFSYPASWTVTETKRRVTVVGDDAAAERSLRGVRAVRTDIAFKRAGAEIDRLSERLASYRAIRTSRGLVVAGEPAVVHVFITDGLRFEQWWVDTGKRTLRIDLWSRPADDEAVEQNERVIASVKLL